ncbi:MAG: ElyC/SanA/YdcF family protein [Formivibrio sp.]|nr:ElyC/SanA/YdcF family protein [Formivibrio sp.]
MTKNLVTSAMHMPRALGVFRKQYPAIEFIPAPTDYHATKPQIPTPWYRELISVVPTPGHFVVFSEAMHEYLGIAYYRMRGWM